MDYDYQPAPRGRPGRTGGRLRRYAAAAFAALALCCGTAAHAFNPNANNIVNGVAALPDGKVLLSGAFTQAGGVARSHFARVNADGSIDPTFVAVETDQSGAVAALPDGRSLVAGAGTAGCGGLLRVNADGSIDTSFVDAMTTGTSFDNRIRTIVPLANGKILIGGLFGAVGSEPRNRVARLNADGSLDTSFVPAGTITGEVYSLAGEADGRVLVGGQNFFARLMPDGSADTATPVPNFLQNIIPSLTVLPGGKFLVGAWNPLVVNGIDHGTLVRFNADATVDTSFHPPALASIYGPTRRLADGRLIVSHGFGNLVRLAADGANDDTFGPFNAGGQSVSTLDVQADGKIVFGGAFASINGLPRGRAARIHPDGRLDNGAPGPLQVTAVAAGGTITPSGTQPVDEGRIVAFTFAPNPGQVLATLTGCDGTRLENTYTTGYIWSDCTVVATFIGEDDVFFDPDSNNSLETVALQPDGRIVAGGSFTRIGGLLRQSLARLEPSRGNAESTYAQSTGTVYALTPQADGAMLVGSQTGLVRVLADGTVDAAFAPQIGAAVNAAAVQPDGKILIGGAFTTVNGTARARIARLNTDGTLDATFNPGNGANSTVYAIVVEPDGRIVVGGGFATYNGTSKRGLLRLNADGTLDGTFPAAGGTVYTLYRYADGRYLVGGINNINLGDGTPVDSRLVRMLPGGTRDLSFEATVTGTVRAVAIQADGKIVVGGEFTTVNGQTRNRLARLAADGALDAAFNVSVNNRVTSIALQPDGKIVIAGGFSTVGAYNRRGITRLTADGGIDVAAFTVTPYAGTNGTITPNVPQGVGPGATTQFTIVPDAGYVIGAVTGCGGTLDGLVYTTGPVTGHCTVTADFLLDTVTYTVTPVSGGHGSLGPSTPQSVLFAQTASFAVTPDPGYFLAAIGGCGGAYANGTYTTGRILADCTVTAAFDRAGGIAVAGGGSQITAVGTAFGRPLAVRVTDTQGRPAAGVEVAFAAPAAGPGAALSAATAFTGADGIASVTARANGTGGAYAIVATGGGLVTSIPLRNEAVDHGGLELRVTVSTAPPPTCGTATSLDAAAGTQLNYCFTVVNRSDVTLNYHTLTMATYGNATQYQLLGADRFFHRLQRPLAPGETYRYNRIISVGAQPQTPKFTWTAAATWPGYEVTADSGVAFTDISTTGTEAPLLPYMGYDVTDLPFPVTFFGQTFLAGGAGTLCINNSGTLKLQRGAGDASCPQPFVFIIPPFMGDNRAIAQETSVYFDGMNFLLPYWDALGANGHVYYQSVGAAPNRRLIVQWHEKDLADFPNPAGGITFQAVIEETTGRIHFVYRTLNFDVVATPNPDNGGSASVGLVDFGTYEQPPQSLQFSYNSPVLANHSSITWTPTDMPRYATADVAIDVGTPRITFDAESVSASLAPGARASRTLTIGNAGNLNLDWSLKEAAARGHFPPLGAAWMPTPEDQLSPPSSWPRPSGAGNATQADSLFAVPAYGVALESGYTYPVSFDAANPTQFVQPFGATAMGQIYGGDFVGDDFSKLYMYNSAVDSDFTFATMDLVRREYTVIASGPGAASPEDWDAPPYPRWAGMAWDPATRTLYASTTGGQYCSAGNASDLYTVDPSTGHATRVAAITTGSPLCIADIAVAPDGAMYGVDVVANALVAIDKHTGAAAYLGSLGFDLINNGPHSLDFDDASGTLYLAAGHLYDQGGGGMFAIDPVSGAARRIGGFPIQPISSYGYFSLLAMGIATSGGECALPSQVPWLSLNQVGGVLTPGSQAPLSLTLDAAGLAPGDYRAQLCAFSNDRSRSLVRIPVSLSVSETPDDRIFADGFDRTP